MEKTIDRKALVVVGAGLGLNLVLGVLYSWSIVGKALVADWGWSSSAASLPYAIAVGVFALTMVFAGRLQDQIGPRLVAMAGGVVCGLGLFIAGFGSIDSSLPVVVGFGLFSGAGIGLGYAAATPAAVKWFGQARKGMVTGIVVSGFGLASIYIAPVTTWLLGSYGIEWTFRILGISFMILALIFSRLIENPPLGYEAPLPPHKEGVVHVKHAPVENVAWRQMVQSPRFYLLWATYASSAFAGLMIIGHMAKIAAVQVPGTDFGFLLVAMLAIGNAAGRLAAGSLSDRIGVVKTMLIAFIGQAAAMLVLGSVSSLGALVAVAMLIGAFYGSNLALFPAVTAGLFGTRDMGVNYGLVFTAWGMGGVFGSMAAGRIFDLTGGYQTAFYIAAGLCLLAAVLAPLAGRPGHTAQPVEKPEVLPAR